MSYKEDIITNWKISGESKDTQREITGLFMVPTYFENLNSGDAKRVKEFITSNKGYSNALENAREEANGKLVEKDESIEPIQQLEGDFKHVLDEDTGELVEITDERREISIRIHERIQGSVMVSAILLQIARDEKIFLAFGIGSFKEYVSVMLPFGERQAYRLLNIADEFAPILPKLTPGSVAKGEIPAEISDFGSLGFKKLYNLTQLPEADYSKILSKRKVTLANGTELDLRDIEESSSREFDRQVSQIRREYQKRISNQEEQIRKYKGEYQHAKMELEKNQGRLERINELEAQFGPKAVRVEDIEHNISVATGHLRKASKYIFQNDLEEGDPDTLKQEINNFLRLMHTIQEGLWDRYDFLKDITQMELPAWKLKDVDAAEEVSDE